MSIRVVDLVKRHPGAPTPALSGLCMDIPQGQIASILGKSGSGKTTLLRCLSGLDPFDGGTIAVGGVTFKAGRHRDSARSFAGKIGLVFQSFELFPHMTVVENCILAPTLVRRVPRMQAIDQAMELLSELGIADKAKVRPEMLSGGQKQRVAIARALCMEPRVLLYDEPTSALDPALKHEVGRTLRRVAKTGVTQIVVTHDLPVAREASDVVFVLDKGRVATKGPPKSVIDAMDAAA
ncbi:MAG: amino acid ABC transporter ATP-binding protein [Polyangiaceae bacterium]|nr:amino acid ABC transporter ATP-binding protein [Polyangiaceae bacterium]